jgi:transcription elongation factor Elf1
MPKTWSSEAAGDVTCEICGSVYAVTIQRFPARDSDSFNCTVCNHLLNSWNSTACPSYELKQRGRVPDGGV